MTETSDPCESFGDLLRRLRLAAGRSQNEQAQVVSDLLGAGDAPLTRAEISRYERGGRLPRPRTLRVLARSFALDPDTLVRAAAEERRRRRPPAGGAGREASPSLVAGASSQASAIAAEAPRPTRSAGRDSCPRLFSTARWTSDSTEEMSAFLSSSEPLSPREADQLVGAWRTTDSPQIAEMTAGRRVGTRLAASVTERVGALRRMDDVLGGRDTHDLVRLELMDTLTLLKDASYNEDTGRRILAAVGELCQLAGWVAGDAGLLHLAERYYLGGIAAAHAADDGALAGHLLSCLSYQVANTGDPGRAVLMATSALGGAGPRAPSAVRALLSERLAWAHAKAGDLRATERALACVDDTFDDQARREGPDWVYWLTRDEIDIMAGRCMTELRRPGKAIELLRDVVERYDETHAREVALYLSWLAEAYVQSRDVDLAAATGIRALTLARGVSSARSSDRLHSLRLLLAPHHGHAVVHDFLELAHATEGQPAAGGRRARVQRSSAFRTDVVRTPREGVGGRAVIPGHPTVR